MSPKKRILVVDDEPAFRELICHWLQKQYDVVGVEGASQALEKIANDPFDLVLSDVTMPGVKGYELVAEIKRQSPRIKVALITAWSVEECLKIAIQHGIGNIIPKELPFNFEELDLTVKRLLFEDIFGLERHFVPDTPIETAFLTDTKELGIIRGEIFDHLEIEQLPKKQQQALRLVFDEAIINAAYHPKDLDRTKSYRFPENEAVEIQHAKDFQTVGFSVIDRFGELDTHTILTHIERCLDPSLDALLSDSGRGLFLIRSFVDKMFINIKKGVRTEIILLVYPNRRPRDQRPLFITEL